jgi:ribosomal protein S18 acetylase RimI-like enzyme
VSDLSVRAARPGDAESIRAVAERSWHRAHGDILSEETIDRVIEEWYDIETTRDAIRREAVGYFVAEADEGIVGYVSGGRSDDPDVATLAAIYVHPDDWRRAIGTALVERFHDFCRRRGYERVRLRVLAANNRARSFYRHHGYELVGEEATELFGERTVEAAYVRSLG